jgi:hypothetical protein
MKAALAAFTAQYEPVIPRQLVGFQLRTDPAAFAIPSAVEVLPQYLQVGIAPPPPDTPGEPEPSPQQERYARPQVLQGLPQEVILYQYEVCPFCNKARAVLDYYKARQPPYHPMPA